MPQYENLFGASLLDRLLDASPRYGETPPFRVQTQEQLQDSIRRDLSWLLNTRCPVGLDVLESRERSVIDYGLPDLGTFYAGDQGGYKKLSEIIESTITAFEPRLQNVRVVLEETAPGDHKTLSGYIEANLVVEGTVETLAFPLTFSSNQGGLIKLD